MIEILRFVPPSVLRWYGILRRVMLCNWEIVLMSNRVQNRCDEPTLMWNYCCCFTNTFALLNVSNALQDGSWVQWWKRPWEQCFIIPIAYEWKKFKWIRLQQNRIWVSLQLNLHSSNGKVPFVGPCHLSKFWCKKPKATTGVTLQEPPIKVQNQRCIGFSIKTFLSYISGGNET